MTKQEALKYKKLLLKLREDVTGEINTIAKDSLKSQKESSGDLSGYSFHMADMASDSYDRELSLNIASEEQLVVYEIDEALKRIEDGNFGKCIECEKKVPLKRLNVIPYAKYCIQCKSKEEKNKKLS
ncbi:MAG: TraR/DksA family transcriptional regulator [Candidatus Omnitrophota bacterium]|nr:TraR/DksA family transcriptional regulator [Candidatus Omnitrophota bacterium]